MPDIEPARDIDCERVVMEQRDAFLDGMAMAGLFAFGQHHRDSVEIFRDCSR
jgi:hypothetical protein